MTMDQFMGLWAQRIAGADSVALAGGVTPERAWELMARVAPGQRDGLVNVATFRRLLSGGRPPVEFCQPELGVRGPVLGTIHASKGREASTVNLMLTGRNEKNALETDEEAKVIYVGATRAKRILNVGQGNSHLYASRTESGRIYASSRKFSNAVQVEFGLEGDFDDVSIVSNSLEGDFVVWLQDNLRLVANMFGDIDAEMDPESGDYIYHLRLTVRGITGDPVPIGCLSQNVNKDLFKIANKKFGDGVMKPGGELRYLQLFGVRTVVLPQDSSRLEEVSPPVAESGFYLVPVIRGYSLVFFNRRSKGFNHR
jgi:hypothetical protein